MECDSLYELGPPPNMILNIPPPPIPPFMEEFVARLAAEGIDMGQDSSGFPEEDKACNLCQWANGNGVGYVELAQKGELIKWRCALMFHECLLFIAEREKIY